MSAALKVYILDNTSPVGHVGTLPANVSVSKPSELDDGDFNTSSKWYTVSDKSTKLLWHQSNAYLDGKLLNEVAGTSTTPVGNYAACASDDPSDPKENCILASDLVNCAKGFDISFNYWMSPGAILQVCTQEAKASASHENCQRINRAKSPGPTTISIPTNVNGAFQILIVAENFTFVENTFSGGFAVIDTIQVTDCGVITPKNAEDDDVEGSGLDDDIEGSGLNEDETEILEEELDDEGSGEDADGADDEEADEDEAGDNDADEEDADEDEDTDVEGSEDDEAEEADEDEDSDVEGGVADEEEEGDEDEADDEEADEEEADEDDADEDEEGANEEDEDADEADEDAEEENEDEDEEESDIEGSADDDLEVVGNTIFPSPEEEVEATRPPAPNNGGGKKGKGNKGKGIGKGKHG